MPYNDLMFARFLAVYFSLLELLFLKPIFENSERKDLYL